MNIKSDVGAVLAIVAALALAGTLSLRDSTRDLSHTDNRREWESISSLVADRDAIVIGIATGQYTETVAMAPTEPGNWPIGSATVPPDIIADAFSLEVSQHEMVSHQTLYDDGNIPTGQHFVMRMLGHPSENEMMSGYPDPQAQYLLFLAISQPAQPGLYDRTALLLRVDGPTVTRPNGSTFPLADGMSSTEFIAAVQDEIETQYGP